jgi:hypothetical protein
LHSNRKLPIDLLAACFLVYLPFVDPPHHPLIAFVLSPLFSAPQDVVISSDGQFCLTGSWDGTLRLWDINTGATTRRFLGHAKDVLSVAFSADNRQVCVDGWVYPCVMCFSVWFVLLLCACGRVRCAFRRPTHPPQGLVAPRGTWDTAGGTFWTARSVLHQPHHVPTAWHRLAVLASNDAADTLPCAAVHYRARV